MTSISRTIVDASSSNAVDGNNDTNVFAGHCALTDSIGTYTSAWWRIRLTEASTIKSINIVSRPLIESRLAGISVYISTGSLADSQFFNHPFVFYDRGPYIPNSNIRINLQEPIVGDYVTVYNNRTVLPFPTGYSNSAILELCEVEVIGCPRGWYGISCQLSCPANCLEGTCDPDTGRCYRGCSPGYTGNLCNENCPLGFYGPGCSLHCGSCGQGMPCEPVDGRCPSGCRTGYSPPNCNQSCSWGFHGIDCAQRCRPCSQNQTCHAMTGNCPGSQSLGTGSRGPGDPVFDSTVAGILVPLFIVIFIILGCVAWRNRHNVGSAKECKARMAAYVSAKTQSGSQYLRKKSRKSISRMTKMIRRGQYARNVSTEITPPVRENARGKENVYINVGIDKVPIITLEEGETQEEIRSSTEEKPPRPADPVIVSAPYENTMIHEIAITELAYVVSENAKDNNRQLKDQFKQLKYGQQDKCDIAKKAENSSKNRFKSLYAYDHSRVKLKKDDGKSDYINANFIDGVEESGAFIACQGPKINTMADHWLMIWEENVCVVVALANVFENGKEKCYQYWPDSDKNCHPGKFVIRQQNRKDYSFYCVRYLSVLNRKTKEERTVVQFHFREWPDHGAPEALSLVTFQAHVRKEKSRMVGKMLVHCSAGVGRTGTFIALDSLLENGRKSGKVNVFDYVKKMRTCRMNMVQTEGQYVFIHEALYEGFRYKKHALSYREFASELKKLSGVDQPTNETPMRLEYNEVESMKPSYPESRYKAALKPINKTRNREDEAMPVDDYRVFLTTPVVGRNDYINAVFQSSHTESNALIITCSPLSHNVGDIWRLVHDHNVDAIVLMGSSGLPEFSHWLPSTEETVEFDPFFVRRAISFAGNEEIVESTAKFNVQESQEVDEVKIFEFLNWNVNTTYPTSPKMMVKMIEHVHDWRKTRYTDGPILIVSVDGVSWCGVFCAGYNAVEQLTFDDEVDIFNIVRHMRVRRPELIPSFEEYQYCYRVCQNYLCSGGPYENVELPWEG